MRLSNTVPTRHGNTSDSAHDGWPLVFVRPLTQGPSGRSNALGYKAILSWLLIMRDNSRFKIDVNQCQDDPV